MDDRVAEVEQDPIAQRLPFDSRRRITGRAASSGDMIGDRADVDAGASRGDDHHVGDAGLAREIDLDDVLGLRIFEAREDRFGEGPVVQRFGRLGGKGRGRAAARNPWRSSSGFLG